KGYGATIAIHFGTTNSCVGFLKDGNVEIITDDQHKQFIPSYVAFLSNGEQLIGDAAKNQLILNSENTIFDIKRLIGREFNDPIVQQNIKHYPFKVIEKNSKQMIQINISKNEQKIFSPEEILAMILKKLRENAEVYLKQQVTHAVVTVPAYFNNAQRQATIYAGTIAGLNIIRIINETTAAAACLPTLNMTKKEGNILVFHLGGGTFDISLIKRQNDIFQVIATIGNTNLGGKDFNHRVMKYLIKLFKNKTGKDIRNDNQAIQTLRFEVEKIKRILSSEYEAKIEIESFFDNENFSEKLTRAKFEELNLDLFRLIMQLVEKLLDDAKRLTADEIVFIGGSTRIPKIQQLIKQRFYGKEPLDGINVDTAAVYGAALQAGFLSGAKNAPAIILFDINPIRMDIQTVNGEVTEIIQCNRIIPTKKIQVFSTSNDNQQTIPFQIFEGENQNIRDNHVLGKFELNGIPPAPQGIPQIEVTFLIDVNGILNMTAEDKRTTNSNNIIINSNRNRLSSEEINFMTKDSKKLADKDKKLKEPVDVKNELELYIYSLKIELIDNEKLGEKLSTDDKTKIETAIEEKIKWLELHPDADADDLKNHINELKGIVMSVLPYLGYDFIYFFFFSCFIISFFCRFLY
ncbi:unnamed protein product, partial [Rotaria sp. Silwood2]